MEFPLSGSSCKKIRRFDDLADVEVAGWRRAGKVNARIGFPLFVEEVLQDGSGVDSNEFFAKDAIKQVDVGGVDAL